MGRGKNRASVFGGQRTDDGPPVHVNVFGAPLETSGLTVSVHPFMPEQNNTPGELFFECTLFLYSVLALFLQYLNLYKSLWWLPKSYWHYSIKFHQINPYFLSCVGLLLGLRVTNCFWKTITEVVAKLSNNRNQFIQSVLTVIEYAFIKTPMMTMVITSFMFSFTKVWHDFPPSLVMQFFYPLIFYTYLFYSELKHKYQRVREAVGLWFSGEVEVVEIFERFSEPAPQSLDHESIAHMCSAQPAQIREEVSILAEDFYHRLKRCFFAGISTAFLSVYLPCVFAPYKTNFGLPQKILIDAFWEARYFVYAAVHLGSWEHLDDSSRVQGYHERRVWAETDGLHPTGSVVSLADERRYLAVGNAELGTVAAQPGNYEHQMFYSICKGPCTLVNYLCIFEGILIAVQFWMLVLTTEWQHICTLVLLMFANYLLLGKLFKDKVFLGRIYDPSPEDKALMDQLRQEMQKQQ
ncbi:unnamed protein product, partial [Mesorhabditis spiculigera]